MMTEPQYAVSYWMGHSMRVSEDCYLHVPDELAGKQGKCIHCGHRITVPGGSPASSNSTSNSSSISGSSLLPTLFESTPESMLRELFRRDQSAMLLVFPTPADGVYDLAMLCGTGGEARGVHT